MKQYISRQEQVPISKNVYIYGAGGAGALCFEAFSDVKRNRVKGFVDTYKNGMHCGIPVFEFNALLSNFNRAEDIVVIASAFEDEIAWALNRAGIYEIYVYRSTHFYIVAKLVNNILSKDDTISILDIGARDAENDPRWSVFDPKHVCFYGFEIDQNEIARLQTAENQGARIICFPYGLAGKAGSRKLYFSKGHPGSSSLFPFNFSVFDRWKMGTTFEQYNEGQKIKPIESVMVSVNTLNSWFHENSITSVDFAKLNIQGAELEVLQGGDMVLPHLVGVLLEVAFVENYHGRPLFGDIDSFMRSHGFQFFDFIGPLHAGRNDSPITTRIFPKLGPRHGQLVEAHALYLRDPAGEADGESVVYDFGLSRLLKLAALAELFGQVEYAFELLVWGAKRFAGEGHMEAAQTCRTTIAAAARAYADTFGE